MKYASELKTNAAWTRSGFPAVTPTRAAGFLSTPTPGRQYTEELWWDDGTHVALTDRPAELEWNTGVHQKIVEVVGEAKERLKPAELRTGRAPVRVGINRRVTRPGRIYPHGLEPPGADCSLGQHALCPR